MDVAIGSNVLRNTNGVVKLLGKEQVVFEVRDEEPHLLLTMDLYDMTGTRLAHLRRNAWIVNPGNRFQVTSVPAVRALFYQPASVKVVDGRVKEVVLEALLEETGRIQILHGQLYAYTGACLEITPHCWRIVGDTRAFGNVYDCRGGPADIK